MESSIEVSQTEGAPKPKLALKPRLTPKPFSLQKNTTIRSIHAPKTVTAPFKATTHQTGKSESPGVPKATLTTPAQKPPQQPTTSDSTLGSVSVHTKDQPKTTKENKTCPHGEDTLDSSVAPGKSDPASQSAPPKDTSKSEPIQKEIQKDDVTQTNHNTSTDVVTNSEQKDEKKKEDETQMPVVQKLEESGGDDSSTANPKYRWGSSRKRLSMELTSMFESGGISLSPQPTITISTTTSKDDANQLVPPDPEQSLTTSEPSNRESDEGGLKEEYSGGGSIKRRISLLFDSSSRPEVVAKREEPEIINGAGGVKERIKNWTVETGSDGQKSEKKPQVVPRTHTKSFDSVTAPTAEKTPKMPPVELPVTGTLSTEAVDPPSKISPAEQPTESPLDTSKDTPPEVKLLETSAETSGEHEQSKSTEGDVQLRARSPPATHTATDEGSSPASESAQHAAKRDNIKRRSVRFGVVDRDDGGPPVLLGSETESSAEEDEAPKDESEEDLPVSVPAYRRVGILQKKKDEVQRQEEEWLKHLESEKRRKAEENLKEKERLKLEEEIKRKEEEQEMEKEKARQMREEEKRREEEKESEKLKEEEKERQRKEDWERERSRDEERERERLREEEMERERQMELMWQRQREEERERAKQKEEILKQDQEEREKERLKEEERKEERLREEREGQRLREEEILIHDHEEHRLEGKLREEEMNKEKQREEEWEKEWLNKTEELRREEEEKQREKESELMWQRQKEEDGERARQKEERLRQEEREKEKLREEERQKEEERMRERQREVEEEEERRRRELERKRQQEKEEMEKMRQIEMERQREEERKRQIEKERAEELERKHQDELERKQAEELEEKLRMEREEREREELMLTNLRKEEDGEREMSVDEVEPNLISFDSEDLPQKSKSTHTPSGQTYESTESQIQVVYDDFSVRKPCLEVDFDDFSVKPKRWGSQAKVETSPVQSTSLYSRDEEVEALVPLEIRTQEKKVLEQVEKPDSPEPTPAQESPEEDKEEERPEEKHFISMEVEEEEKEEEEEEEGQEEVQTKEDEGEEDDKQETQVNSYCTDGEDKDTDALIDCEPDQQNRACEPTSETDSPKPAPDQLPEVSSEDVDIKDFHSEPELAPFPESSTPLLDTSAQRSKADLGKKRSRTRPSRSLHAGLAQTGSQDWRSCDSTVEKEISSKQRESDSEEEQPKLKIVCSPPPTSQRVPMFPGLSPAALFAHIKKRAGGGGTGGGEETEDKGREEKESPNEEIAPSPSQLSRSPRSAAHLAGAARVLPPIGGADGGAISSPAWLKELKSKKRLSQHEGEA